MDVVVAHANTHGIGSNCHAFDHDMGVVLQDLAVFASAWFAFVGVTHQIFLSGELAGHEAPLQASRKACTTASTQTRFFDDGDDLVLGEAFTTIFA